MATVSRTLNPLHFEDLEPRRFEDLVRQLAYDFRPWRKLEPTGRSGSDDGFDARGWEVVGDQEDDAQAARADEVRPTSTDRIWLIQCKRERAIGPTKLTKYLDDVPASERPNIYGIIFAAACDFSKSARDGFISKCRDFGFSECHLWGKGELEDMLFQPKNDHLLFAYFGFSLAIRRRSIRTELRSRLAMKRKAYRVFKDVVQMPVLVRDPRATEYPYSEIPAAKNQKALWRMFTLEKLTHKGIQFAGRKCFAFVGDDGVSWDMALAHNRERLFEHDDPWSDSEDDYLAADAELQQIWNNFPERNRAWLKTTLILSYESIFDIDEDGDDIVEGPHIYATFEDDIGPFQFSYARVATESRDPRIKLVPHPDAPERIHVFPDQFRDRWPQTAPSATMRPGRKVKAKRVPPVAPDSA